MSERDIKRDRAMCEAATKGPWKYVAHPIFGENSVRQDPVDWNGMGYQHICVVPAAKGTFHEANGRFIAESREALPHYIARAEEAESALAHERRKVEAAIEELRYRPCPEREKARTRACEDAKYAHLKSYDALCPKCWSDYLDQKAKEGEGK